MQEGKTLEIIMYVQWQTPISLCLIPRPLCFDKAFFARMDQRCCVRTACCQSRWGLDPAALRCQSHRNSEMKRVGGSRVSWQGKRQVSRGGAGASVFSFSTEDCRLQKAPQTLFCTSGNHPPPDATLCKHRLETVVQRYLLVESQRPSGQWAHSWLQESPTALFWSRQLRRQSVASEPDQAAGEIGTKALAATIWPQPDVLFS